MCKTYREYLLAHNAAKVRALPSQTFASLLTWTHPCPCHSPATARRFIMEIGKLSPPGQAAGDIFTQCMTAMSHHRLVSA